MQCEGIGNTDTILSKQMKEREAFTHYLPPPSWGEWVLMLFCGIILAPIRLCLLLMIGIFVWTNACIGMIGADRATYNQQPQQGWRTWFQAGVWNSTGYFAFWCLGFRVRIKGTQAPRSEAPVIIVAPHSSFLDICVIAICRGAPVARIENSKTMAMGVIQDLCNTIYVERRSNESRQQALTSVLDRARSPLPWPPLFLFSEGTTTNGKFLIRFQTGGFKPGTPVQPLTIQYSRPELTTWTRDQSHSIRHSFLRIISSLSNQVTLEFLPVYYPSVEEQEDSVMFAKNVQKTMADSLGLEATDVQRKEFIVDKNDNKKDK